MVKKLVLLCLIGIVGVAVFLGPQWAFASPDATLTTHWIAQMETSSANVPQEQPSQKNTNQQDTQPAAEKTPPKQTTTEQQSSERSQSKPFNPYDMKALKRFDAGDHRAK
ncbi:hypothetical protein D0962_21975 [Leptolyngbyaceae cyanobacterium CCMR0082]|uniref:Uncharacterized protein n=2 Tax=Adonisia turfae TaxID=2950184 RepID=A0A6M0SAS5_9CYAN|nr:hypothetical protein [Adonisia turfae]MDV3347270.1 hypothetical protein [Leptothoe sp. LEGE 181152]NEZ57553.1 hypothetical protein [Adonisia turfae CCMR0081]NEZ65406.1 hypothetical protein [Adonisia turfae CCMR0082]